MNLANTKIFLDKINRLHRNILNGDNISQVERDLMLQYVRQLYDACLEEKAIQLEPVMIRPQPAAPTPKVEVALPPPVEKVKIETPPIYTPPPVVVVPPIVEKPRVFVYDAPPVSQPQVEKVYIPMPPKPVVQVEQPIVRHEPTQPPAPPPAPAQENTQPITLNSITKKHGSLFEYKEATDIMTRLSESPIEDITKAMNLNDRILTVRELFKSEQGIFDQALRAFNGFGSFEEAKNVLLQLAERYDWSAEEKRDEAKNFIKLVRRRYKKA
jgi:hypothetical protein